MKTEDSIALNDTSQNQKRDPDLDSLPHRSGAGPRCAAVSQRAGARAGLISISVFSVFALVDDAQFEDILQARFASFHLRRHHFLEMIMAAWLRHLAIV